MLRKLVPGSNTQGPVARCWRSSPLPAGQTPGERLSQSHAARTWGNHGQSSKAFPNGKVVQNPWGTRRAPALGCPSLCAPRPPRGDTQQGWQVKTPLARIRVWGQLHGQE